MMARITPATKMFPPEPAWFWNSAPITGMLPSVLDRNGSTCLSKMGTRK